MRIGSLFSGIGGLELGLEWAGLGHTAWQVEQSAFCRRVLARHWPDAQQFGDVCSVGSSTLAPVDVVCGGFPCQDISSAGKGAGLAGSRSGLWSEFARIIEEMRPRWVVVENVASGANRWVDEVWDQLERISYEALPVPLSAYDVGAPHRRKRVFIVAADADSALRQQQRRGSGQERQGAPEPADDGRSRDVRHANRYSEPAIAIDGKVAVVQSVARAGSQLEHSGAPVYPWHFGPPVSPVRGVDDGISDAVDRLHALGNAVVPQCAEVIGWIIREIEGE